jgi:hypothetical protein
MDNYIELDKPVGPIGCKKCGEGFTLKAGDHLGENPEGIAWGCPNCKEHVFTGKKEYCVNCGSKLGIDCGEAEPDYNTHICSVGCYEELAMRIYH